jgi:hypothetical protein
VRVNRISGSPPPGQLPIKWSFQPVGILLSDPILSNDQVIWVSAIDRTGSSDQVVTVEHVGYANGAGLGFVDQRIVPYELFGDPWRPAAAVSEDGTLTYTFAESVKATYPFYAIRLLGGVLYLGGMLIMAWNCWKTLAAGKAADAPIPVAMAHA